MLQSAGALSSSQLEMEKNRMQGPGPTCCAVVTPLFTWGFIYSFSLTLLAGENKNTARNSPALEPQLPPRSLLEFPEQP